MKKKLIGIEIKRLRLSDLKETTGNPQKMTQEQFNGIVSSMKKQGWLLDAPVVWEKRKDNYQIISGHHRIRAAIEAGIIETDVKVIKGINEEQARKLVIEANQRRGQLDNIELNDFINTIVDDFDADIDILMEEVGILDDDIIKRMLDPEKEEIQDDVPEVKDTYSKAGDIYELNGHRVMCGDSTVDSSVDLLMNGNKANMYFTDPPYSVNYTKKAKEVFNSKNYVEIKNDNLCVDETSKNIWSPSFRNAYNNCFDDSSFYITMPQGGDQMMMMMMMMMKENWNVKHELIWIKDSPVFSMGRLDYDYQHEPIAYGWKKKHNFYKKGEHKKSVWNIKRTESKLHPTMKPVELIENAINNSTMANCIILDTFLGSGSTLIAAEKTKRICYGIEIDPHYCDVIVQRYINYVGSTDNCYIIRDGKKEKLPEKFQVVTA